MPLTHLITFALMLGASATGYAKPLTVHCWPVSPAGASLKLPPIYFVIDSDAKTVFKNGVKLKAEWNELSIMTREDDNGFAGEPTIKRSFVSLLGRHGGEYTSFWEYTKNGALISPDELENLARELGKKTPAVGMDGVGYLQLQTGKCEVSIPKF